VHYPKVDKDERYFIMLRFAILSSENFTRKYYDGSIPGIIATKSGLATER
jgi:hypothetical protein